ncbi:MAG: tyrosine-type recombinase/integrase, partial [Xanthobacteraceae bacterium]
MPVLENDTVYWDAGLPGFGVKVTPKGRKVFLVMYRLAGAGSRLRKYTIGPYGRITLPMAKAQAQKIFAARLDGRDPAEEKKQSRRRLVVDRVDDLVETFIREHVAKIGTNRRITSLLRRDVVPYWGAKSIHEIKKRDVSDLISLIAQRNAHASHRLLKTLKTFFRWCVGRAVIDFSPAEGISAPYREVSRDRVLTDQELAAIILSARRMSPPYGRIVEFLALTGQRREEVAQLKWDELDEKTRTWTIPGSRTKNKKAHIVHLSEPAWKVIEACSGQPYVFGTATGKRFQQFGRGKRAIDKLCGVAGWRLHDLRRTIVSGMARLGIPPHVADKILNHQAGTISGVAAVYQRHDFLVERKEALDRWGAHVERILRTFDQSEDAQLSIAATEKNDPASDKR